MRAGALEFAHAMAAFWEEQLGPRLLGFYLIGSLAHGGFNRRYSDIDLALVAENGLSETSLDRARAHGVSISPELASKQSLFWSDRRFSVGRFPPLDRVDYLDHAVALVEREPVRPERPSVDDIRAYLRGAPFAIWAERAARFATLDRLEAADHKPYLRALLYPARFVYSWSTGRMASNEVAVAYLDDCRPAGLDTGLIARALHCRSRAADPDDLFGDRNLLPGQVDACRRLITG
ncbi:MAG: nucleotidyltransferase domain-containing protein [Alphaproteobacteria bacterium]